MAEKQSFSTTDASYRLFLPEHGPSWKVLGKGTAGLEFRQYHPEHLSFSAHEYDAETKRNREVMFTLSRASAEGLRDYLIKVLK